MNFNFLNYLTIVLTLYFVGNNTVLSQSQNFINDFELSSCSGSIPEEFKVNSLDKINEDIKQDKSVTAFYEKFRFSQQKILFGGKVLFGDELSNYVNKVANNLLEKSGNSKLKNELRFYVLKSDVVNALCMADGSIFITVGLLSQIENEAQLAYIISHEITHYTKQHSVNDFNKEKKLTEKYENERLSYKEAIKTLSNYSKENELESDKEGFVMFKKAGYDSEEAINSLIVLQYSHLPFDEVKFNTSHFDNDHYIIPKERFTTTIKTEEIEDNSEKDDTYATHPNIKTRIDNLDSEKVQKGVKAFFSDEEFNYIRTKARFENQFLHLLEKNFIKAIYESYLLKKKYPNNKYLDECIAGGLYGLSKFKTNSDFFSDYENKFYGGSSDKTFVEGESLVLYEMFEKMNKTELNILALKFYNTLEGKENKVFVEDLMYDLIKENNFDYKTFKNKKALDSIKNSSKEVPVASIKNDSTSVKKEVIEPKFVELDSIAYLNLSKIEKIEYSQKKKEYLDKIRQQKLLEKREKGKQLDNNEKEEVKEIVNQYYLSAFVNELEDSSFLKIINKVTSDSTYRYYSDWYDDLDYIEKVNYNRNKKNENYRKESLNIDSLIIVEPAYYELDGRREYKFFISKSLENKKSWSKSLEQSAKRHKKNVINLAYTHPDSVTIDKLQLQFALKEWHNEMIENSNYGMLPFSQERTTNILDSLGYNNILISGLVSERIRSNPNVLFGAIIYPLAPLFLAIYVKPKYQTYKYVSVIDKNGFIVLNKYFHSKKKANVFRDRLFIEDIMNQISNK